MVYTAYELLAKLRYLTLIGQNYDSELEWVGTTEKWNKVKLEEEAIVRDFELSKI